MHAPKLGGSQLQHDGLVDEPIQRVELERPDGDPLDRQVDQDRRCRDPGPGALGGQHDDPLLFHAPQGEAKHAGRGIVQPLQVVDRQRDRLH